MNINANVVGSKVAKEVGPHKNYTHRNVQSETGKS